MLVEPSIPHLKIPFRVGIAFVPESSNRGYVSNFWTGENYSGALSEARKMKLLENVAEHFKSLEFVSDIEIIPTAYLTSQGGFSNLSQIKTMYGIDIIALVSYDQVQFSDEGLLSLSYWTIVGAYVVSGEENDTSTLMDTVVYDIDSKKMLFRAPGTSQISGSSTPVNRSKELRNDSLKGFEDAATVMIENLKAELDQFKASLKDNPSQARVTYKPGYSGGGSLGIVDVLFFLSLLGLFATRKFIPDYHLT